MKMFLVPTSHQVATIGFWSSHPSQMHFLSVLTRLALALNFLAFFTGWSKPKSNWIGLDCYFASHYTDLETGPIPCLIFVSPFLESLLAVIGIFGAIFGALLLFVLLFWFLRWKVAESTFTAFYFPLFLSTSRPDPLFRDSDGIFRYARTIDSFDSLLRYLSRLDYYVYPDTISTVFRRI